MNQIWDFYVEHLILIVIALIAGIVLGLVIIELIRIKSPRLANSLLLFGACASLILIFVMTFSPVPNSNSQQGRFTFDVLNGPGTTLLALTDSQSDWQDPVGNILLFIPISVALNALVGSTNTRISLLLLTISIEASQFVIGYGRSAELIDIVLNYAGVEIGVAVTALASRFKLRKVT
jgi:glycopeptide antibiotics resistance protein